MTATAATGPSRSPSGSGRSQRSRWARRLGFGLLLALIAVPALASVPAVLGYGVLTVHSGSMEGTAPIGSAVVTRSLEPDQVRVDDVILVRAETAGVTAPAVLHRVISRRVDRSGEVVLRTKGDANPKPDPLPYVLSGPTMTPVLIVPYVGYALAFVRTPIGWTAVVALPATVLLWLQLQAIWAKPRRRPLSPVPPSPAPHTPALPRPDHVAA